MNSSQSAVQRYIVFLNEKVILISEDINSIPYIPGSKTITYSGDVHMKQEYAAFKGDEECNRLVIHAPSNYAKAVSIFRSLFTEIEAAGGIVRDGKGRFLAIRRFGLWDLPKGKLEKGEIPEEGAIREVTEETALYPLEIRRSLPNTYHIYTSPKGKEILKTTFWFAMHYQGNATPVPQIEEGITEVKWFDEAEKSVFLGETYASLRQLMQELEAL